MTIIDIILLVLIAILTIVIIIKKALAYYKKRRLANTKARTDGELIKLIAKYEAIPKEPKKSKLSRFKNLDFTDPTTGSILIAIVLVLILALFPEYWHINVAVPIYMIMVALLAIFLIPIIFVKYYYMPLMKFVPELKLFIHARKYGFPLTQDWDENGFFTFVKSTAEDITNLPKSYTIRGLEIYQKLNLKSPRKVYKEAFQNISTNFAVTDIQSFRQIIEILNKQKDTYLLKLIIIASFGLFLILIGLGVSLKLSGKM